MKQLLLTILSLMVLLIPLCSNANNHSLSLLIQTDKAVYASGETLAFKCTPLKTEIAHNEVLFIDLCGEDYLLGHSILKQTDGNWKGQLLLSDSIQTGVYLLRAYTGSPRGEVSIETLPVTIINRFGHQQINEYRKKQAAYQAFDPVATIQGNQGTELRLETANNLVNAGDTIVFNLNTEAVAYQGGISFSVFKTDTLKVRHAGSMVFNQPDSQSVYDQLYLSGHISDSTGQALASEQLFLSFPDSIAEIDYTFSDEAGNFRFSINQLEGHRKAIIQLAEPSNKVHINCYDNHLPPPSEIPLFLCEQSMQHELIQLASQRAQINLAYEKLVEENKKHENVVFRLPFYGLAQKRVHPSDYVYLESFNEIARELLPNVKYRIRNRHSGIQLWDPIEKKAYNQPMILLDGVPLYDPALLNQLNSSSIRWIDLQPQDRCYGMLHFSGLIAIQTNSGTYSETELPENATAVNIQGYSPTTVLNTAKPLFCDVLLWKPHLHFTGAGISINVPASLETGTYVAIAQAVNSRGEIQRAVYYFNVEQKKVR